MDEMTVELIDGNEVPAAVVAANAEAERLQAEMDAQNAGGIVPDPMAAPAVADGGVVAPAPVVAAVAPVEPAPATQVPPIRSLRDLVAAETPIPAQGSHIVAPAPIVAPVAPVAPVAAPVAPVVDESARLRAENQILQQKHDTLMGKYNSEVPTMATQLREIQALAEGQQKQLTELANAAQRPIEPVWKGALTTEEQAEYTTQAEALGTSGRAALAVAEATRQKDLEEAQKARDGFDQRLKEMMQVQQASQAQNANDRFWASVDASCPNASMLNVSPEFIQFMNGTDPVTGLTYMQRGQAAMADENIQATVKLFEEFKQASGFGHDPQASIESQVRPDSAPGTGAEGPVNAQPVQPVYRSQIKAFLKEVASGEYAPDPERHPVAQKIMAVIDNAQMAGQVIEDV